MYPETDIPPVEVTDELLAEADKIVPEPFDVKLQRFIEEYGLSRELAKAILNNIRLDLFEKLVVKYGDKVSPTIIAATIENTIKGLRKDGVPIENISDEHIEETIALVARGVVAKEAIPEILAYLARNTDKSAEEAAKELGLTGLSREEIESIVDRIVSENIEKILERGERSFGLIMGKVMAIVRGKADGKLVASIVRAKIKSVLASKD